MSSEENKHKNKNVLMEWKIDNFSCWKMEVHGYEIPSSTLIGQKMPKLKPAYKKPKDLSKRIHVRVFYLCAGTLSFLCPDGSLIHSVEKGTEQTILPGPTFEEVVTKTRRHSQDRLVLRYECVEEKHCSFPCEYLHTILNVFDASYRINPGELAMELLLDLHIPNIERVDSMSLHPIFLEDDDTTALQLQPAFEDDFPVQRRPTLSVRSCTCLVDGEGSVARRDEPRDHVFNNEEPWIFTDSLKMSKLKERGLSVLVKLKVVPGTFSYGLNHTAYADLEVNGSAGDRTNPDLLASLTRDLRGLYDEKDQFSDFDLKCDNVSFPVHKVILSARSPVFKAMLSTDMKEGAFDSVDIEDLDPPTLGLFLRYLYTGSVQGMEEVENVLQLYYAADKYQVPVLKTECVDFLRANISVATVCDVLSLAERHGIDLLTIEAHAFILKNLYDVVKSEEWRNFVRSEPLLAANTLTDFAQKKYIKN